MLNSSFNSDTCITQRPISTAQLLHSETKICDNTRLVRFPSEKRVNKQKWVCNISEHLKFSDKQEHYLQINPTCKSNQFDILCGLLKANTCHVIYFDCKFSEQELREIRHLQAITKTELINSKFAFCLAKPAQERKTA